jgi:predicted O-linked N-acetylglucosamine transferase (SPINDLY family)
MTQWQTQAYSHLLEKDYGKATKIYEQVIIEEPETITHYFYLGLLQLLQEQETEAQFTWMACITDQTSIEQIDAWTSELVNILYTEAERQRFNSDYETAWLICQHIHEIAPDNLDNLLVLVWLSIELKTLNADNAVFIELIENLTEEGVSTSRTKFNHNLLWELIASLLKYEPYPFLIEFIEACLPFVQNPDGVQSPDGIVEDLINASIDFAYLKSRHDLSIKLLEICLIMLPEHLRTLIILCENYHKTENHSKELETAKLCYELSASILDKSFANALLLKALLNQGGTWQKALSTFANQESLLLSLSAEKPNNLSQTSINRLYSGNYFGPYIRDEPRLNRSLQNQISQLCQANTNVDLTEQMHKFRQRDRTSSQKLKIGYISHCMASHSVGWLARWLIRHHDRNQFQLYGYFHAYRQYPDDLQSWYESQMDQVYRAGIDGSLQSDDMADKIYQDQIDILVDLDSITLDGTCGVMALKPAPIQVTWLGWDASGIPAIDYFIADPYVLPDSAQEYYSEKIWRLPQTYIAVDGFEVAVPSLRRDQLDISADAVVYLSAQRGYKRNIDTVHLQMQIIKSVPNSYFLIKGLGDQDSIQDSFIQIAIKEGVDPDRLRFLSITATEAIHRANMAIADIVLDTYPYNGATTTLETLWMCIPLVTRVGEQFAARNSYTMMMNAGISEGIAWSADEYVEWGVRLGKDAALRQDIATRLKTSRQTAPLWNGEKFTREMEIAYKQMWQNHMQEYP